MRLIDADEFAIEEPKKWDWSSIDDISSTAVLKQCIWDVQCAPTVKAIPLDKPFCKMVYGDYVVYNKKWLMKHLPMELDILQGKAIPIEWIKDYITPFQVHHDSLNEEEKENDGPGWVVDVLETMLREWEKENEKGSE